MEEDQESIERWGPTEAGVSRRECYSVSSASGKSSRKRTKRRTFGVSKGEVISNLGNGTFSEVAELKA